MRKYKRIYVEVTNVCNLSCDFCPENKRSPGFISVAGFEYTLKKISPYTNTIYLHVMGEPLLHPDLGELLDKAYIHGFRVNITTNGTLIKKSKDILINKKSLKLVNFSLHSFDSNETLDSNNYFEDIFDFIRASQQEKRIMISLRLWNAEDMEKGEYKSHETLKRLEKEFCIDYNLEKRFMNERSLRLSPNVILSKASRFDWPDMESENTGDSGFCYGLRNQFGILVDGTVVPCCLDSKGSINLGNIYKTEMADIINSGRALNIYNGFSKRKVVEDLCKRCGYRKRFNMTE
ncbi:S-adenosyl-L-methionine-dependent 2-deoxy-scyllo-inosamine dehydrogenase [Oxobacter pfennigii]|uniref:S-adenosyl-L-methionine-dependent 2-deoxy-scyllo-inosamine dehydrogenase n=2 Tax=Oxobacter pfennigii TaxID=36849 RepID=A0A0P9AIJ4_9CLOT|nr:S-adenosyl-L-methionine-dependent 2-deoxy-scyllo-inosamine dehydrogenase [Oxobacter pfennigii]